MKRQELIFQLDKEDVEKAIMQFICACHPDVATGHTISVYHAGACVAIAHNEYKGCGILEPEDTPIESNLNGPENVAVQELKNKTSDIIGGPLCLII
jgi:hypothetical protein